MEGVMLTVLPIYGNGPYWLEVFDVVMLGGGSLALDETGNYLQVGRSRWELIFR